MKTTSSSKTKTGKTVELTPVWSKKFFINTLVKGTLMLLPLAIIFLLLSFLFGFVLKLIMPISNLLYPGSLEPHWSIHIVSMILVAAFIFVVGSMVQHRIGRMYFTRFEDNYLSQIPMYNAVRETVQQFSGLKNMPFQQVVLADPFGNGVMMTGFVTEKINEDLYTIFVPTAPNPTNGNIYHVPRKNMTFLDISAEEAMRSVVGMGTGSSVLFPEEEVADIVKLVPPHTPSEKNNSEIKEEKQAAS